MTRPMTETIRTESELRALIDLELADKARRHLAAERARRGGTGLEPVDPILLGPGGDFRRGYRPGTWAWPGNLARRIRRLLGCSKDADKGARK